MPAHGPERDHRAARRLGHVSTLYATLPQVEAASRLAEIAPGGLTRTFFTTSGTEAVEAALIIACVATGRNEIVALRHAYHGRSLTALALTANSGWKPLASPVSGIAHAKSPNPYRCPYRQPCDDSCAERFAQDLEEVILTATSGRPAAFIAETIQGVAGYVVPPRAYFAKAAEVIRRHGGLLIVDEVQAGFGRSGRWFAIEHFGVEPDLMVMAKGIAGGMPVGATMMTEEVARRWKGRTFSTFGANPIAMAALCATQDVLREADAPRNAEARGAELRAGLEEMQRRHPWMGDVRGMGLMQAVEVVEDPATKEPDAARARRFLEAAREEGVLVGLGGLSGNVIRIGPSLLIGEAEIAEGVEKLARAADAVG
ncbi:MAG TPA: aspartate aminotransferase family protein [Longimicrobiales bacterium]|nr:aspartate aminotransferase family protein [Longimicrobiales bacterium]